MDHTEGIVLRTVDFSETSLILAIYTKDFGKLKAIAKGGRRLKSAFESSLDLFNRVYLSVIQKRSDHLDILTESKLIWRFHANRSNYAGIYAGYTAIELLDALTEVGDPNVNLYDLLRFSLADFEKGTFVMRSLLRFEWILFEQLGHRPELKYCAECGNDVSDPNLKRLSFAPLDGGVLCPNCRMRQHAYTAPISRNAIDAIERLSQRSGPMAQEYELRPWALFPLTSNVLGEVRGLTTLYMSHLLERKPRIYNEIATIAKYDREHDSRESSAVTGSKG